MLNLLLILALAGMIVISAAFAGVTFMQGVQSSLDAAITTQRLLDVATEIQSHARYLDPAATGTTAYYSLPAGSIGGTPFAYNQVPSFVTGTAKSANGVPFEYCPYTTASATVSGTSPTTITTATSTYSVDTVNIAASNSQTYVVDNGGATLPTTSDTNMAGLLIAAAPNKFYPPDCSQVGTDSTGAYTVVPGGQVAVIANDYLNDMKVPSVQTDLKFYVSQSASGDGSGRDVYNYMTLSDALTLIQNLKPASAMIYVDATGSPTYSITTTTDTGSGGTFSRGGRIYLEGINGSGAIINTSTDIAISEYSTLSLGNLTLQINGGTGTMLVYGTLEMADTSPVLTVGSTSSTGLKVYGGSVKGYTTKMTVHGDVTVDVGGTITSSGAMLFDSLSERGFNLVNGYVYGGTSMEFDPVNTNGLVPLIIRAGGNLIAGTGTMLINGTGGINGSTIPTLKGGMVIEPGGKFIAAPNSNNTGSAYYNSGSVVTINKIGDSAGLGISGSYGFYVHGEMDIAAPQATGAVISYSNLTATGLATGIVLASGGKFQLEAISGVTIGSAANHPIVGIQDNGGSGFFTMASTGTNTIYASTSGACWQGSNAVNLFSDSQSGTVNGNSTAPQTVTFPGGFYQLYNNSYQLTCQRT